MTPAASLLQPASNPALYISSVLTLYVDLPDTPLRASTPDQWLAHRLFETGVPFRVVETALLAGVAAPPDSPSGCATASPIRSLAYFQPVIEELQDASRPRELPRLPASQTSQHHGQSRSGQSPKIYVF